MWSNQKQQKKLFSFMSHLQTYNHFKLDLKKNGQTYKRQVINPLHQTPHGKSVANPGTPLQNILVGNVDMI